MALKLKSQQTETASPNKLKKGGKKKLKVTKPDTTKVEGKAKPQASGFLKKGKAAKEALVAEQQAAKLREEQRENQVFRFYLKPEQERTITFLDGDLDADGDLDTICYYEHTINNPAQGYPKFVCINDPANGESCPICESGDNPYFATVFTVLTHEVWHSKKENKDFEGSVQLFVAKSGVADKLRKKAKKLGGLTGATFEVSRSGKDAFNVGDDFDFVQKNSLEEIQEAFPDCDVQPLDYDAVIKVHTREELHELGFGSKTTAIGGEEGVDEDDVV